MTHLKRLAILVSVFLMLIQLTLAQNGAKIERLNFSYADFFDQDDNYKYEADESKMPWNDAYGMIATHKDNKQLIYKYSKLIDDSDEFESKELIADVNANAEEQTLCIDYIFYGYDRYNLPDDADLPPNNYNIEYGSPLYPLNDHPYRIVGNETITTKAGTFNCILIEAVGNNEELFKLWMISDKPGVYAKIIEDKPGMWGHYVTMELIDIK